MSGGSELLHTRTPRSRRWAGALLGVALVGLSAGIAPAGHAQDPPRAAVGLEAVALWLERDDVLLARRWLAVAEAALPAGPTPLAVRAALAAAELEEAAGDPAASARAVERADALASSLPEAPPGLALAVGRAGLALALRDGAASGSFDRAGTWLARAAAGGPALAGHAAHALARLAEARGDPSGALAHNDRGFAHAARLADGRLLRLRLQHQRGGLLATRDPEASLAQLREAARQADALRPLVAAGRDLAPVRYEADLAPVYTDLARALLAGSERRPSDAPALLRETRDAMERSRVAELEDYFRDECVREQELQQARMGFAESAAGAALVYPVVLPERLELLVTLPDGGMARHTVPVPARTLAAEADHLRALLEKRTTRQYLTPARRLYDWLLRPLVPSLAAAGVDTLVWIPDRRLRGIPLSALHDGERFVVERFAVAVTPSLALTDAAPRSGSGRALFAGLSASRQGFAPLPFVPVELAAARERLGGELLLDEGFRVAALERSLASEALGVVHLATHGRFEGRSEDSFVVAYDGRLGMAQLGRQVRRFRFRDEPLDLLVLSACETAAGDDRAALGLAGMAVRAGARSVVGTLWLVNDAATAELIGAFYRELARPGTSRARALQRAKQQLLATTVERHPGYWSPFLLVGSWR